MMELEEHLILEGEEEEESICDEMVHLTQNVDRGENDLSVDESMSWSLLNGNEEDASTDQLCQDEDESKEEESSQAQRSILQVDSRDSIPSKYENSTDLQMNSVDDRAESVQEKVKTFFHKTEQVPNWLLVSIWLITFLFTIHFGRQSSIRAGEIENLKKEIVSLKKTLSDFQQKNDTKYEAPGWFIHSSELMKDWATAVIDIDINEFTFSHETNESTFLDIIPDEAFHAIKNLSTHVATAISDVIEDVGVNTKEVLSNVGESVTSFGESFSSVEAVTEKFYNVSDTLFDIVESQKYALIFGALYYEVYENFFNNDVGNY